VPDEVGGVGAVIPVVRGGSFVNTPPFPQSAIEQLAIGFPFHQQAADELGGDLLGGAGEEGLPEVLGEVGGYGVALRIGGGNGKLAQTLRLLLTLLPRAIFVNHTHNQLTQISSSQKKNSKLQ
jgi:hypothetical protein